MTNTTNQEGIPSPSSFIIQRKFLNLRPLVQRLGSATSFEHLGAMNPSGGGGTTLL